MNATQKYLTDFFAEKEIPFKEFKITGKDNLPHYISTSVVIESIMNTSDAEQRQIAMVLRKIDYVNGNVQHFLKFLAHGLVQQYSMVA